VLPDRHGAGHGPAARGFDEHTLVEGFVVHPPRGRDRMLARGESVRVDLGRVSIQTTRIGRRRGRFKLSKLSSREAREITRGAPSNGDGFNSRNFLRRQVSRIETVPDRDIDSADSEYLAFR
jgi:hypothetical protein